LLLSKAEERGKYLANESSSIALIKIDRERVRVDVKNE